MMLIMHGILMEQREYRDKVLKTDAVEREAAGQLRKWANTDMIKVITGPRRAGKSWLAIRETGENAIYVNFDDERLIGEEFDKILRTAEDVYGRKKTIVLDEVQNVENWQLVVNRLQRQGRNVIITGSNSKLLSSELATYLTGRFAEIRVLPFSYREFLQAKRDEPCAASLEEYLRIGGFPEVVVKKYDAQEYAALLLDAGIVKDVVMRYRVRYPEAVRAMARFAGKHAGKVISIRGLATAADIGSPHTAKKYLTYLESAFLFAKIPQHTKEKHVERAPVKVYPIDTAFLHVFASPEERKGVALETAVFLELLHEKKSHQEIRFWKSKAGREVDFIILENGVPKIAIQASYDLNEAKTRELKALEDAKKELGIDTAIIVTMTPEATRGAEVVAAWDFVYDPSKYV